MPAVPEVFDEEIEEEFLQQRQHQKWLEEMIQLAVEEERLACGVEGCVKLLQNPEEVMVCVLPNSAASADALVKIQHTLIKAFCLEYYIRVVTTDSADKLTKLIHDAVRQMAGGKVKVDLPPLQENSTGFTCIMVKYPKESETQEEVVVDQLFKPKPHVHVQPYIELPN